MKDYKTELNSPLDHRHIRTRAAYSGGPILSYIEGHHAIREMNRIFGPLGWGKRIVTLEMVQSEKKDEAKQLWYVGYNCLGEVTVQVGNECKKTMDVGFGQGQDKDLGRAHESAIKEAVTDMMKRCLKDLGDPLGLALYDKAKAHVADPAPHPVHEATVRLLEWCGGDKSVTGARWRSLGKNNAERTERVMKANSLADLEVELK